MFPNANLKSPSKNTKFHDIVLFIAGQFLLSAEEPPQDTQAVQTGVLSPCVGSTNYPGLAPTPQVTAASSLCPAARSAISRQLPLPPLPSSGSIKKFNTKLAGRRSEIFESLNVCCLLSGLDSARTAKCPLIFLPIVSCASNVQVVT